MIIPIPLSLSPYNVHVGAGLLAEVGGLAASVVKPGRCALVTDSNVGPLYAKQVGSSLREAGFDVTTLVSPAGESSKCMAEAASLCDRMIAAGLDRSSCLAALGGGCLLYTSDAADE